MNLNELVLLVSLIGSITSIVFSFLAFKRSEKKDYLLDGKSEGQMHSDIGYIKACVNQTIKNLEQLSTRYQDVLERLSKVEESLVNVTKRVDEVFKIEGG